MDVTGGGVSRRMADISPAALSDWKGRRPVAISWRMTPPGLGRNLRLGNLAVARGTAPRRYTRVRAPGAARSMLDPVILGADHAGFELKEALKRALDRRGIPYEDVGTQSAESVDYPDFAHRVAEAVGTGRFPRGVLVCGTGIGMSMAANRHPGVRAAAAYDETTARLSREHNDANVLALGGRTLDPALAERILEVWLETPFAGGRHAKRVAKIETR